MAARHWVAGSAAAAAAAFAVILGTSGGDDNLRVSPAGTDSGDCRTVSCGTLAYAYTQAEPGDVIELSEGTYGNETIAYRSGMSASRVTVRPEDGEVVALGDVLVRASYLNFQDLEFRSLWIGEDAATPQRVTDITVANFVVDHQDAQSTALSGGFNARNAVMAWATDNVTLLNGSIGNTFAGASDGQESNLVQFSGVANLYNTDWIIDGVRFHDNDAPAGSAAHNECVYALHVQGLTIRNSRFESCTYYGIFFTDFLNAAPGLSDVLLENNVFHTARSTSGANTGFSIDIHANVSPDGFVFRHNTIENAVSLGFSGSVTNGFEFADNLVGLGVYEAPSGAFACKAGVTFTNNVFPNSCGTNTTTATEAQIRAGWAGASTTWGVADDLHLLPGSPAVDAGSGGLPATDYDAVSRGNPSDAGAYELPSSSDSEPPSAPTDLVATGEAGQIVLTWTASTDNVGVTGYRVHRSTSSGFTPSDGNLLESVVGVGYDDTSVTPGTTYYYKVVARDAADNRSSASGEASASASEISADTANLWVDTDGGTCTRQGTAAVYSDAAACGTWDAAWDAANSSGDVIRVKSGNYGSQSISGDKVGETEFIGEDPVLVTGQFFADGNNMTMSNVTINTGSNTGVPVTAAADDVTWENVNVTGTFFSVGVYGDRFTWDGGQTGGLGVTPGQRNFCLGSHQMPVEFFNTDDSTFLGVTHMPIATVTNAACNHAEYFNVRDAGGHGGLTIKNGFFSPSLGSTTACIFISDDATSQTYSDVLIENTFFGTGCGSNGAFSPRGNSTITTCDNFTLAYNTFASYPGSWQCTWTNSLWVGNLGPYASSSPCSGTHTLNRWQYNIAGSCGTDVWTTGPAFGYGNLGFDDQTGLLNAGSVAIDAAETPGASDYCTGALGSVDRDGTVRPQGDDCDAGADERP